MKNEQNKVAIQAAQALIDRNLSEFGREMSVRIAAHLQYVEGYFRDYRNELYEAVERINVAEQLPKLVGEGWAKMSRTQQRQVVKQVEAEVAATVIFVRNFQRALTAQAGMIEQANSSLVERETSLLARDVPENQPGYAD